MITKLTYNCAPDSIGDIEPEAFVDAFENALAAIPRFEDMEVRVTFNSGRSKITSVTDDGDGPAWDDDLDRDIAELAGDAFNACCLEDYVDVQDQEAQDQFRQAELRGLENRKNADRM